MFVDEDAGVIARTCEEAELDLAQLHGEGAREALPALPRSLGVIYVMHVDSSGLLQTAAPASLPAAASSSDLYPCRCFMLFFHFLNSVFIVLAVLHFGQTCARRPGAGKDPSRCGQLTAPCLYPRA